MRLYGSAVPKALAALVLTAALALPAPPAAALSGTPPTAQEVLEAAEFIVIARAGEELGTLDQAGVGLYTLYRLRVESYIRPAAAGPDTLVLAVIGGGGLYRYMNGPKPGPQRALYFLKHTGSVYTKAAGAFTPTIPMPGDDFSAGYWESGRVDFRPLLHEPRHPAHPPVTVRLNGRAIGGELPPHLVSGRTLFPAAQVAAAMGASLRQGPDGEIELVRGDVTLRLAPGRPEMAIAAGQGWVTQALDVVPLARADAVLVPLRAVASAFGAAVGWEEAARTVTLTLPGAPAEPPYLSREEAEARLAEAVEAIMSEHARSGPSFSDRYAVAAARFDPAWLDPRTGGEQAVWELDVTLLSGEPMQTALVDAVTGAVLWYVRPAEGGGQ